MNNYSDKFVSYYELLGIHPKAGLEETKQAYRNKLKEWHPDKNPDRIKKVLKNFPETAIRLNQSKAFNSVCPGTRRV
jgi:curved DNA-binding protein CbpA